MNIDEARRRVSSLLFAPVNNDAAYMAGFDCGQNGATMTNCHFRYFATEQLKAAWEQGKSVGEMARASGEVDDGR